MYYQPIFQKLEFLIMHLIAVIDGEFVYYTFKDRQSVDIAIFNTELHDCCIKGL